MRQPITYAGVFVGELGHEMFSYSGRLRWIAQNTFTKVPGGTYEQVFLDARPEQRGKPVYARVPRKMVVACKRGREIFYRDFAERIISLDIETPNAFRSKCRSFDCPPFEDIFGCELKDGDEWIGKPNEELCKYYWRRPTSLENQSFVKLGRFEEGSDYFDILFHSRNRSLSPERNYNRFAEVVELIDGMPGDYRYASIGSLAESDHVPGTVDLRGTPLPELCDVMANALLTIGPSSGPMHLASLCECAHLTWFGSPYTEENESRYYDHWNPHGTPCRVIAHNTWQPTPATIAQNIRELFAGADHVQ